MKERPILFSAPMVRALLAGTKTQTRRALKPQPSEFVGGPGVTLRDGSPAPLIALDDSVEPYGREIACPYGQPGDRLWVRESFMPVPLEAAPSTSQTHWSIAYAAGGITELLAPSNYNPTLYDYERWTPSIHMPRWASRITLEITSVRVERLQEISIEDAKAEGAWGPDDSIVQKVADYFGTDIFSANPRKAFQMLWESINGPDSWAANPWVWAIEFRRVP